MGNGAALFAPVLAPILDSTCSVGTRADACLSYHVTAASRCRDESRHRRQECLRHIGWAECEICGLSGSGLRGLKKSYWKTYCRFGCATRSMAKMAAFTARSIAMGTSTAKRRALRSSTAGFFGPFRPRADWLEL